VSVPGDHVRAIMRPRRDRRKEKATGEKESEMVEFPPSGLQT
jgi:hypothetical protein